jgi:hypothetical protein
VLRRQVSQEKIRPNTFRQSPTSHASVSLGGSQKKQEPLKEKKRVAILSLLRLETKKGYRRTLGVAIDSATPSTKFRHAISPKGELCWAPQLGLGVLSSDVVSQATRERICLYDPTKKMLARAFSASPLGSQQVSLRSSTMATPGAGFKAARGRKNTKSNKRYNGYAMIYRGLRTYAFGLIPWLARFATQKKPTLSLRPKRILPGILDNIPRSIKGISVSSPSLQRDGFSVKDITCQAISLRRESLSQQVSIATPILSLAKENRPANYDLAERARNGLVNLRLQLCSSKVQDRKIVCSSGALGLVERKKTPTVFLRSKQKKKERLAFGAKGFNVSSSQNKVNVVQLTKVLAYALKKKHKNFTQHLIENWKQHFMLPVATLPQAGFNKK